MKKFLLTAMFVTLLLSVGANAQTVFVPSTSPIYIPQFDPLAMMLQNDINSFRQNGAIKPGEPGDNTRSRTAAKNNPPAAVDYTAFKPRAENYLPKLLAQKNGGNADQQREEEQFYNSLIESYEQVAKKDGFPATDLAYAFEFFIVNNYAVYYNLIPMSPEMDPYFRNARNDIERIRLKSKKESETVSMPQERKIYYQFRSLLQSNPDIKKMNDEQKQTATEFLAIMTGAAFMQYDKGVQEGDEQLIKAGRQMAKENLEKFFKVPIEKIKISDRGFQIQ